MADIALEFNHIWKKFSRAEMYDSLRDLIPALLRRSLNGRKPEELKDKEFWAVRDVSFQVKKGEALGIIGHNGAGKSTILKLLSGILRPNRGEITYHGRMSALIEVGAGFHPDLTGRENVYLNGAILGMRKEQIGRKFDEIVEFSGISEFIDTPVKRYSSGMFARLGFSVAVHVDPEILLVDEVLSVGDWSFQNKCLEKIQYIMKSGSTVVLISHNLKAIDSVCSRTLCLDHGKVTKIGNTSEVIKSYLEQQRNNKRVNNEEVVSISRVILRNDTHEIQQVEPGDKSYVDVFTVAEEEQRGLSIGIYVADETFNPIFSISSERLGHGTFSLKKGDCRKFTFQLDMHLAKGMFHLGVILKRYDIDKIYDHLFPAATFFVQSRIDVRGSANLYPRMLDTE